MPPDSKNIDLFEAINNFESIRSDARQFRQYLEENYQWTAKYDIRIGVFEQIDNLIRSLTLSTVVSIRGISDSKWIDLQLFRSVNLTQEEKIKQLKVVQLNLHSFHRIGYIYALMQVIEGAMRSIARETIPEEDATGPFGKLCKKINQVVKYPDKFSQEMVIALDLLKEIRNTIHNNGFYYPNRSNKEGKTISYRGQEYYFAYGKPHNNANYSVLGNITRDIIELFKVLVEDPVIANIEKVEGTTSDVFDRISG